MADITESELIIQYTPFIRKAVRPFSKAKPFWKKDMFQVACVAFWQGWKKIGRPYPLSPENLSYLGMTIKNRLINEFHRFDGTAKHGKVLCSADQYTVVPFGLSGQDSEILNHADKLPYAVNLDACSPYFTCTLREWLNNVHGKGEGSVEDMLISGYSAAEIKAIKNVSRDTVWRKKKALLKSFSDYVDLPKAAVGA